jgi:hypothetical protein
MNGIRGSYWTTVSTQREWKGYTGSSPIFMNDGTCNIAYVVLPVRVATGVAA